MTEGGLKRSCRACLNENPAQLFDWNSLVDDVDVHLSYAECFQRCTQLDATEELPQIMCYDCAFELREAYLFIRKARTTHWKLRVQEIHEVAAETACEDKLVQSEEQDDDVTVQIEIASKDCNESELEANFKYVLCDGIEYDDTSTMHEPPMPEPHAEEDDICEVVVVDDIVEDDAPPFPQVVPASEEDKLTQTVPADQKKTDLVPCKICCKIYPKKWLSSHMSQVHVEKNWLCHVCSRTYKTQHALRRHCSSHEERPNEKIKCEICGRKFARRVCYKTHMLTHKKDRKAIFSCDECNKSFFSKNGLTWHKKFHTGDTFDCNLCNKPFARPVDLKKHMLYHSNIKPYKCPQCDQCFRDVYVLNQHLRTKHQGYMYKCDFCSKEYASVSSLDKHRSTHVGLPNQCGVCGKGFWNKPKLVTHLKKDHKISPDEVETYVVYVEKVYRPRHRHVLQIKPTHALNEKL